MMPTPMPTDSPSASLSSHWIDITYAVDEALREASA